MLVLSRVRSIDNLFIIGTVSESAVRVDYETLSEYERLRKEADFF